MKFILSLQTFLISMFIFSCGEWGWQDVESDHESQLNVLAMISIGDTADWFVEVYQSLDLETDKETRIKGDTIYYGPDSTVDYYINWITVQNVIVDHATVFITDGEDTTHFFMNRDDYKYDYVSQSLYEDTIGTFSPEPGKTYYLDVKDTLGRHLTGVMSTPELPTIYEIGIPDTLRNAIPYTIRFNPGNGPSVISQIRTYIANGFGNRCGAYQSEIMETGDTSWTSTPESCDGNWWWENDSTTDTLTIEVKNMDPNYYEYFIKIGNYDEFVNFLMGASGNSGHAIGLEGGYGVFGAVASSKIERLYKP